MKLSTRIALWAAAVVPLLVALAGLLLLPLVGRDLRHQQDTRLNDRAAAVLPSVRALVAADSKGRPKAEQTQQRKVLDSALDAGVRVAGQDGAVLLSVGPQPADAEAFPAVPGGPVTVRDQGRAWRVLTVRVGAAGAAGSGGTLWVVAPAGQTDSETAAVRRRVLLVALVAAPVSALIGFVLAERATAPLRRLSRRAAALDPAAPAATSGANGAGGPDNAGGPAGAPRPSGGDDPAGTPGPDSTPGPADADGPDSTPGPADADGPDSTPGPAGRCFVAERTGTTEVDELSAALALLLARYDEQARRTAQALDTARAFSSTASHELRTPLMSLRTNLDVLAAHPDLPAADRAEIVAELRDDHARMLDLLTALAALARGDLVQVDAFRSVDLAEVADAAVGEAARRHPRAAFEADVPQEVRVFGWEPGLRIMLANLLGNAAVHGRHGQEPAQVALRLAAEGKTVLLTVDDRGPGIGPAEREAVFRRFHRRRDSPGSGLGLTLVAQQVALHRGTVRITTAPGGGCRMEVRLPRPRPDAPTIELPAGRDWISGTGH